MMLYAEVNILVGQTEIVSAGLGMNPFPFERIFRGDGIELRLNEGVAALILPGDLRLVDRRSDDEVAFESLLQWSRGMSRSRAANHNQKHESNRTRTGA
jgi:hypothetical protein